MKKGDKVRVYQRPLTREEYEGEATLVRRGEGYADPPFENWYVRFHDVDGDSVGVYLRLVEPTKASV